MFLNLPRRQKAPDAQVEQDSYNYQDARDWTIERMALKEKTSQTWLECLGIAYRLTFDCQYSCGCYCGKKEEAYPFIVELDKSTGTTRVIDLRDPQKHSGRRDDGQILAEFYIR